MIGAASVKLTIVGRVCRKNTVDVGQEPHLAIGDDIGKAVFDIDWNRLPAQAYAEGPPASSEARSDPPHLPDIVAKQEAGHVERRVVRTHARN